MNFFKIKNNKLVGIIDWTNDGKDQFYALELIIVSLMNKIGDIDPNYFADLLTHDNAEVRRLTQDYLKILTTESKK